MFGEHVRIDVADQIVVIDRDTGFDHRTEKAIITGLLGWQEKFVCSESDLCMVRFDQFFCGEQTACEIVTPCIIARIRVVTAVDQDIGKVTFFNQGQHITVLFRVT